MSPATLAAAPAPGAVTGAPARDPRGLHLLPAGAAAVLRADPAELERAAELVRSLGGDAGMAANAVSLASASALGFDGLSRAGWRSIGVDSEQPVLVALGEVDPTAASSLWHVRVLARVADPRRFADWAGRSPILGAPWHAGSPVRGALAGLLGLAADPRAEAEAARALTERGTISAGARPGGALILVRRIGRYAAIDAFAATDASRINWPRDAQAILERLDPPGRGAALSDRTSAGARALARPGLVLWARPDGLFDAALTWFRPPAGCLAFRDLAPRTALIDAAASLRIGAHQIALDVAWGAAPGAPVTQAWP
ncbi:MAG TPA: hypothetical protein VNO33_20160, partial [Kofleriaceae bacterium]|nr:hypothetical protein [Kofleriaceae bacterium]